MLQHIVGLDLGHGVIRAAEVSRRRSRRPTLHRYNEVDVPADAIRDGVVVDDDAVVSALTLLWKVTGFRTRRVVLGMGSTQVLIREVVLPDTPLDRLRESLRLHVHDLLPLPVDDAVLDFYPVERIERDGDHVLRGLLVAATRESVLANTRAAEQAGLRVADVDAIPFAIVRVASESPPDDVRLHLHIGAFSTNVVVTRGELPQFVRVLPSGSADLTARLAERLDVRPRRADELKRSIGLLGDAQVEQSRLVATVTSGVVRDLAEAVRSTVAFYERGHDSRVAGVVLSGGGARLRGLADEMTAATGLPVVVSRPEQRFAPGPAVDEGALLAAGASPAVALGLALGGAA